MTPYETMLRIKKKLYSSFGCTTKGQNLTNSQKYEVFFNYKLTRVDFSSGSGESSPLTYELFFVTVSQYLISSQLPILQSTNKTKIFNHLSVSKINYKT